MEKKEITEEIKEQIKKEYESGTISIRKLSKKYEIGVFKIRGILGKECKISKEYYTAYNERYNKEKKEYIRSLENENEELRKEVMILRELLKKNSHQ